MSGQSTDGISELRVGTPSPSSRMGALARAYPELASFTADATLLEIKARYGLGSFEEVRRLGRRRTELAQGDADTRSAAPARERVDRRQTRVRADPGS